MVDLIIADGVINEAYCLWERNVPFLYDILISHAPEWSSLSVQRLPGMEECPKDSQRLSYKLQRMILGVNITDS
ncbi:hypothetical protein M514_02072 [Trichuris suis]|uniref:Histone-binding protein RBBP4-like N-terminal domain-containing protein n=1 Tax=Trichuris suis TaxID=68888 RepID=A0A085N1M4_9BILA|nr:hypothetical protein M513_02072 [Trichuris suis]KFD63370.1 hypothetical protein M514_02072 [Trichuris suis]